MIGQGRVPNSNANFIDRMFSDSRYIGTLLVLDIPSLVFVFKCCIKHFYSMETLLFLILATFSVGSVYYTWFMLIIFSTIKYFELMQINS